MCSPPSMTKRSRSACPVSSIRRLFVPQGVERAELHRRRHADAHLTAGEPGSGAPRSSRDAVASLALPSMLDVRNFRNLERVGLYALAEAHRRLGQQRARQDRASRAILKLAATSKSFRTPRPGELVRHGERVASGRARFVESPVGLAPLSREQLASIEIKKVSVRVDGSRPATLGEYATRSPVVVFHPQELELSNGAAGGRRLLLDRLALFREPRAASIGLATRSRSSLGSSSFAATTRRTSPSSRPSRRSAHGTAQPDPRAPQKPRSAEPELLASFGRIAAPGLELTMRYRPGGSEDEAAVRAELERQRPRDVHRPTAGFRTAPRRARPRARRPRGANHRRLAGTSRADARPQGRRDARDRPGARRRAHALARRRIERARSRPHRSALRGPRSCPRTNRPDDHPARAHFGAQDRPFGTPRPNPRRWSVRRR